MELRLRREVEASSLIRLLESSSAERGVRLEYLPITESYVSVPDSARTVYREVKLIGLDFVVRLAPVEGGLFVKGERYGVLEVGVEGRSPVGSDHLLKEIAEASAKEWPKVVPARDRVEEMVHRPSTGGDHSSSYRLLVVIQGGYGRRVLDHIRSKAPSHWAVLELILPRSIPEVIDDPSPLLPSVLPPADLVLFLSEDGNAPQLVPEIVTRSGAKGLIAPIDNGEWMPAGQVSYLRRTMERWGVESAYPRPFCALTEVGRPVIDEFASRFGKPAIELEADDSLCVHRAVVRRGAPCGCSEHIALHLLGVRLEDAAERTGLAHHHYPCLASMVREKDIDDTLMHLSGFIAKKATEDEVRTRVKRTTGYIVPRRRVSRDGEGRTSDRGPD